MWNDVCVVQTQDAMHGSRDVVLTVAGGFKAATGNYNAVVLTYGLKMLFLFKKKRKKEREKKRFSAFFI